MRSELKPNWTFTGPRMEQATVLLVPVLMAHEIPLCEYAVEKTAQNSKVEPPDPNADLYAAIPWAKSVGLELKQGEGAWVYQCAGKFYCQFAKGWTSQHQQHSSCGHPTRTAALASPPPKPETSPTVDPHCPPDVLAAKALLDELAEVAMREGPYGPHVWSGVHPDTKRMWRAVALATLRHFLSKPVTEEAIDAAARMFADTSNSSDDLRPLSAHLDQNKVERGHVRRATAAALEASRRSQLAALEAKC